MHQPLSGVVCCSVKAGWPDSSHGVSAYTVAGQAGFVCCFVQARREEVERGAEAAAARERAKGVELREAREALWAREEEVSLGHVQRAEALG